MKKILVASDSFKGTLSSIEIGNEFKNKYKNTKVISISDGGEGFVESLLFNSDQYSSINIKTVDDLNKDILIKVATKGSSAFLDVASIIALHNYPNINPTKKTTKGIGIALRLLEENDSINKVYIGLGGSSTNDMGFYASLEIGFKYLDNKGQEVSNFNNIIDIVEVIKPHLKNTYIGLSDVENPLLGNKGALRVFGKQKGMDHKSITKYEKYFNHLAKCLNHDLLNTPGSGAAGGLGYFVLAHLNGELKSGIKEMIKLSDLQKHINDVDLVITGEGSFDDQSFYGKAPYEVAKLAGKDKSILIAGLINADKKRLNKIYKDAFQLKLPSQSTEEAIKNSLPNLKIVIEKIKEKYL